MTLQTTGNSGDTSWGWTVTLIDDSMGGTAVLQATDADGRVTVYVVNLALAAPIPVTSPAGLALLAALLAAAAAVALRRS